MLIKCEIYRDNDYWCARGIGADIFTQGRKLDEVMENIREAVSLHYEERIKNGEQITVLSLTEFQVDSVAKISGC